MLFTYRSHPVLEKFKNRRMGLTEVPKYFVDHPDRMMYSTYFRDCVDAYRSNVTVFSSTFLDALEKAQPSISRMEQHMVDVLLEKLTRQKIVSGCYIYRNWALCYWFQLDTESEALCSIIHWFHKNQLVFAGIAIGNEKKFWSDEEALRSSLPLKDYDRYAGILGDILLFMNFLEYAPIETKEVGANKRVKDLNVKYCNQTETNVRIIDSKWFTTLIKTQGFGVRGHLRLQAVGPGKREKRFVWVTDYVKKGYTRIAQKLQNEQ